MKRIEEAREIWHHIIVGLRHLFSLIRSAFGLVHTRNEAYEGI